MTVFRKLWCWINGHAWPSFSKSESDDPQWRRTHDVRCLCCGLRYADWRDGQESPERPVR